MPTGTFEYRSPEVRQALETAFPFVSQMPQLVLSALSGHVLAVSEPFALGLGRQLLAEQVGPFVERMAMADSAE